MQRYFVTVRNAYGFLCTFPLSAASESAAIKASRGAGVFVSLK
jgi:hypothetical protein